MYFSDVWVMYTNKEKARLWIPDSAGTLTKYIIIVKECFHVYFVILFTF